MCIKRFKARSCDRGFHLHKGLIILGDPTSVDCGPPPAPWNGSLESYTNTTEGSVVFYSCDPGLVPEMRMRARCIGTGWSPNPGVLSCSVGMWHCKVPAHYFICDMIPLLCEMP